MSLPEEVQENIRFLEREKTVYGRFKGEDRKKNFVLMINIGMIATANLERHCHTYLEVPLPHIGQSPGSKSLTRRVFRHGVVFRLHGGVALDNNQLIDES